MDWKSETQTNNGETVEVGTIIKDGREYSALGAVITPRHAAGYPKFKQEYIGATGTLQSWEGKEIGTCRITGRWATPQSFVVSHMHQIEATINGVKYTGRGFGDGMLWKGKRVANQN